MCRWSIFDLTEIAQLAWVEARLFLQKNNLRDHKGYSYPSGKMGFFFPWQIQSLGNSTSTVFEKLSVEDFLAGIGSYKYESALRL